MATLLLDEHAPSDGRILVLGAGGGLELKAFAEARPHWRLTGVDPSEQMLALAKDTLGSVASRVEFLHGFVSDAPAVPFDGATCILTLHFLDRDQRRKTLAALYERMAPGARLVLAHHSFAPDERPIWIRRYAAYSGVNLADALSRLTILSPAEDEAMLRKAGFADVDLFYAGLNFRGWVATRR